MSEKHKLVPMKPTQEMLEAGVHAIYGVTMYGTVEIIFCAMLAAAPEVEQEPVAWARMKGGGVISVFHDKGTAEFLSGFAASELVPLYMHAQPAPDVQVEPAGAEQQPDVTLLLELLSHARCNTCDGSGGLYDNHGLPHQCQWCHDRSKALAAHRKGGDT